MWFIIYYWFALILFSCCEKAISGAITSSLESFRSPLKWEYHAKCLFQWRNMQTCGLVFLTVPLVLRAEQGSCKYRLLSHWFDHSRNRAQDYRFRWKRSIRSVIFFLFITINKTYHNKIFIICSTFYLRWN